MKIKQVYIPYTEWEDWLNGMWRSVTKEDEEKYLIQAIELTGDYLRYGLAMKKVAFTWDRTMLNSLTNTSINQRAFVGHCACSYAFNCPEYITRMAWKELTSKQRYEADKVAQQTIDSWKIFHFNKRQLSFDFKN